MKKKVTKIITVVVIILVLLGIISSAVIGKMVADGVMYQNENTDTKTASVRQLTEGWGYDLDGFYSRYEGTEVSAVAEDGNVVPGTAFRADAETESVYILLQSSIL